MTKDRIFIAMFFLFIYTQVRSQQLHIDISAHNSVIDITIKNTGNRECVIGLQNWQIVPLPDKLLKGVGLPSEGSLLNFLFVTPDPNWNENKFYILDWEMNFDSIPKNSLKILESKKSFKISLVINDSIVNNFLKSKKFTVSYVYSTTNYVSIKKYMQGKNQKVFFKGDSLLISNVFKNSHYIEKPSSAPVRFYNKEIPQDNFGFARIREKFIRQIFNKKSIWWELEY